MRMTSFILIFLQQGMDQFASSIKAEISSFLERYTPSYSLPKANETNKIGRLESNTTEISQQDENSLIPYLLENFPEIKRLDRDAAEVLHDTIQFVIKSHKDKGELSISFKFFRSILIIESWILELIISLHVNDL